MNCNIVIIKFSAHREVGRDTYFFHSIQPSKIWGIEPQISARRVRMFIQKPTHLGNTSKTRYRELRRKWIVSLSIDRVPRLNRRFGLAWYLAGGITTRFANLWYLCEQSHEQKKTEKKI